MLTAMSEKSDIVIGLNIGADDYISKPFDEEELSLELKLFYGGEQNDQ